MSQIFYFLLLTLFILQTSSGKRQKRKLEDPSHMFTSNKNGETPSSHHAKIHRDVCDHDAACVVPVQCPAHFYSDSPKHCRAMGGRNGICCSTGHNHTEGLVHRKGRLRGKYINNIDPHLLGAVVKQGRIEIADMHMRETRLLSSGRAAVIPFGSPSYGHFRNTRVFSVTDLSDVMNVANRALEIALATREFKNRQGLTNQQLEWGMVQQNLRPTPLGSACNPIMHCPLIPDVYRRIDGSCNNIFNPAWGTPLSPYARLLPPSYQDGIWSPRVSEDQGQPLASPRRISTALFSDADVPNPYYTLMIMQYGQFLSHEITQSIDSTFVNGSAISCCTQDGFHELPPNLRHFACMPIYIPPKDPFYSHFKQGCMNFVRSVMAPRSDCTLGYAQQMNKVTHFIDGSSVYGSTPEQTAELRSFEGGRLKVFLDFGRELLPLSKDPEACITMEQGSACFESGDSRTNQMISLVVIHTLFMREHNRLAYELGQLNPQWSDEKIFLEARRILTAEMQVITYKEFLPALLGDAAMEEFEIGLQDDDYSYDYDQRVEPSVTNEFASAAFRFGHSTVDGLLKIYGMNKMDEMISIPETMFYPGRMRKHLFYDQLLSTLTTEPIQQVDNFLSDALTKYLFRAGNPFGVDLAALNIQRGRDHGLRPYNDYRQLVGEERYKSFADFGPNMGSKLAGVYASVDDVDLWVGGLIEPKYNGAGILGVTFRDIIADQFARLKKGDKYFFDHDPSVNPSHFTLEQLQQLRKASLSRFICDNSDGHLLARQAVNAFKTPGVPGNEYFDCKSSGIPRVNLMLWQQFD